jgi:hypothetical protein
MPTNKYNRGMPIIKRHTAVEATSDAPIRLKVASQRARVTPIVDYRWRQDQFRVRAFKMRVHTFFWALAS